MPSKIQIQTRKWDGLKIILINSLRILSFNHPIILFLKLLFDQFFNERFLVDVLKLGISYGLKNPFWEGGMAREVVTRTVMKLMARSGEAEEMRRRATEMGQKARSTMETGGSSQQALVQFISEVRLLAEKHGISGL